jgi:glycine cleavage system H protein
MRFTPDHEWIQLEGDVAKVGITEHAAEALGDLVFLEVKEPGTVVAKGDIIAVVESVKAASEIYAPVAGTVVAANDAAVADPALVNQSPLGAGWLLTMNVDDPAEVDGLLDDADYGKLID